MKNKLFIFLTVPFLFLCISSIAQEYEFKVLVNKGKNEIKSGSAWLPVKVGSSLKSADELKVSENSYIGLVHVSGKPLEVKQSGKYKVVDLASKINGGASVLNKYTDFILSANTSKKGLTATGAVHRGASAIEVYLPKATMANVYTNNVLINWDATNVKGPFEVVLKSMFGDELQRLLTNENHVSVNLDDKNFSGEDNIIVQVLSKSDKTKASENYTLKRLTKAEASRIDDQFTEVSKQTSEETALNKLVQAGFFEQNKLLIDANTAFNQAIDLAPDVPEYKEAYQSFLIRNEMKQNVIKK